MNELIGWVLVGGLAVAIACIFMLSSQLEKHTRDTAEMMLRSNQMLLARLERLSPSTDASEFTLGVVLEKTHVQRRADPVVRGGAESNQGASKLPRRRVEDLLQA